MSDPRPEQCRQRLIDEGKAYLKSSCTACGMSVFTPGFGGACQSGGVALVSREPSQQVRYCIDKLTEQIAPAQAVVDGVCAALELVIPQIEALETKAAEPPPLEEYRPGRVCVLQSGGQLMTITEVLANGMCTCIWHAEDGGPRQLVGMPKASLRLRKEADSADAD